jgi:hypothetical protein
MPKTIKVYVLTDDVDNTDKRARRGPLRDMPEMFMEGEVFVHEVIVPLRGGKTSYDAMVYVDDDDLPMYAFERGTAMYEKLFKHVRRGKPSMGRLMHEYNAYLPHTVSEILQRLVQTGVVALRQLEDVLIQYRRDNDYDMLGEDDTIMLPKPGRSKLDDTEGRTDATRDDYDPDMSKYKAPDDEGEEDEDEEAIREAEEEIEAEEDTVPGPFQKWLDDVTERLQKATVAAKLDKPLTTKEIQDAYDRGDTPKKLVDWAVARSAKTGKAPKPKAKPKAGKAKPKKPSKVVSDLADAVYEVLAQTPGKTRRLSTLAEMTGAKTARDVYLAMDLLAEQGRVDGKGRAVIKGKGK